MGLDCNPSVNQYRGIGIAGIVLFTGVLVIAAWGFYRAPKISKAWWTPQQNYFLAAAVVMILDLPRYYLMAVTEEYMCSTETWTYSLHILANAAFFVSYSVICSLWQTMVGPDKKIFLFTTPVLVSLNVIFLALCIAGASYCATFHTIFDYFETTFYTVYTIISGLKNLFFFGVILWSGVGILRQIKDSQEPGARVDSELHSIVRKLQILLVASFIAIIFRFIALCIKLAILHEEFSGRWYTGPAWWVFSDFIPRLLPLVGFMFIMFGSTLFGKSPGTRMEEKKQGGVGGGDVDVGESEPYGGESEFKQTTTMRT